MAENQFRKRRNIAREPHEDGREPLVEIEKRIIDRAHRFGDPTTRAGLPDIDPGEQEIYRQTVVALQAAQIPFLVGGGFARFSYAGSWRYTKDLDIFVKPQDLEAAMDALEDAGFRTKVSDPLWLAKAFKEEVMIDLIFGSSHGLVSIDDRAFEGSVIVEMFGVSVPLLPIEEIIAMLAYVAKRDRFDGSEILHLIQVTQGELEWQRVLERMGDDWELLLWHLILFDWVYPGHSHYLPQELMGQLLDRVRERWAHPEMMDKAFRGTLIDPVSFAVDVNSWDYEERREERPLVNKEGKLL